MARKLVVRNGITSTVRNVWESPEDSRSSRRSWNESIKAGGGIFGAVSLHAGEECERLLADTSADDIVDASLADYAERVVSNIRRAKAWIGKGNADGAARFAWDAGVAWATATMKFRWETHALRGEKTVDAAADGAAKTNARHEMLWAQRSAIMDRIVPRLGVQGAAKYCEARGLGNWPAIVKQWGRRRKK